MHHKGYIWLQANGNIIEVHKMDIEHILNCMKGFETGRIRAGYLGGKHTWGMIFKEEISNRQKEFCKDAE